MDNQLLRSFSTLVTDSSLTYEDVDKLASYHFQTQDSDMNAQARDANPAEITATFPNDGPSPDEEMILTYRQVVECQIRGGLEALEDAIDNLVAERKEARENDKNAPDALTLLRQQHAAYLTHLFLERVSSKSGWSAA